MSETGVIRGFKVFNPDWTCRDKQYTCPGAFEEDVIPSVCDRGIHFCKRLADCFSYYSFNPENKVAEVIAYADRTVEDCDKCATNYLEIVREISWQEVLEIVNTGKGCTGLCNSGDRNSGKRNSGNYNSGDWNAGHCNSGKRNSGDRNSGDWNSGDWNSGDWNSGDCNSGKRNSGDRNSGDWNSGDWNSGDWNSGDCNSGDWNKCSFSNGCFNTAEPKIYMFNKQSDWTYRDWLNSDARRLLNQIQGDGLKYVWFNDMTDEEQTAHPEAKVTGGYLKQLDKFEWGSIWWRGLNDYEKSIIKAIPNFDKEIFKEITGVDVDMK